MKLLLIYNKQAESRLHVCNLGHNLLNSRYFITTVLVDIHATAPGYRYQSRGTNHPTFVCCHKP